MTAPAWRPFVRIDLACGSIPDAKTLLKFRRMLYGRTCAINRVLER
jgi:hypothetical protein